MGVLEEWDLEPTSTGEPENIDDAIELKAKLRKGIKPHDGVGRARCAEALNMPAGRVEKSIFDISTNQVLLVGAWSERVRPGMR